MIIRLLTFMLCKKHTLDRFHKQFTGNFEYLVWNNKSPDKTEKLTEWRDWRCRLISYHLQHTRRHHVRTRSGQWLCWPEGRCSLSSTMKHLGQENEKTNTIPVSGLRPALSSPSCLLLRGRKLTYNRGKHRKLKIGWKICTRLIAIFKYVKKYLSCLFFGRVGY